MALFAQHPKTGRPITVVSFLTGRPPGSEVAIRQIVSAPPECATSYRWELSKEESGEAPTWDGAFAAACDALDRHRG